MPVADGLVYTRDPMSHAAPPLAMELRHNEETLGRVYAGAIEIYEDEVFHVEPRFWMGLRGIWRRVSVCTLGSARRSLADGHA